MKELETEKTILVRGVHWTRFLPAFLILSASVALMLLKTRPPGLLVAGLPFIISRHIAIAAYYVEWAVTGLSGLLSFLRIIQLSKYKYIITDRRLIKFETRKESGYLDIEDILSATTDKHSPAVLTSGRVKEGNIIIKSRMGKHILHHVDDPDGFVHTLSLVHDGKTEENSMKEDEGLKLLLQTDGNRLPQQEPLPDTGGTVKRKEQKDETEETTSYVNPLETLDRLVGLESVKEDVKSLRNFITVQKMRRERGIPSTDLTLHTVFTGNPGTGKTTVARIMASIFKETGILPSGHLVEVDRSGLVAEYVGQTAAKTNNAVDRAMGGVLFIDEAYSLTDGSSNCDYGHEAVTTLLKRMEDDRGRFAVILAGYTDRMSDFLRSNPGLKSRFPRTIHFPDYTPDELEDIYRNMAAQNGYRLDGEALRELHVRVTEDYNKRNHHFGNGRYVRNLFELTIKKQADRIMKTLNPGDDELSVIKAQDICETTDLT